MMRSSMVPAIQWGYWANVFYILGMFGYLTMDTLTYVSTSMDTRLFAMVYVFLATIFVIDAILYTIDWYMYAVQFREKPDEPIRYRAELAACICHNIGSHCYLIGAIFAFGKSQSIKISLLFYFLGILSFLLESGFDFPWLVYHIEKKTFKSSKI